MSGTTGRTWRADRPAPAGVVDAGLAALEDTALPVQQCIAYSGFGVTALPPGGWHL